jgi:hypothetical protein
LSAKAKIGRPAKHGGFSLVHKDELLKEHPYIQRYLRDCRAGIITDLGGEETMTAMQMVMVDRLISRMAICRLIEAYIEKYGAFNRVAIQQKRLELEPVLASYLSFSNSIDRTLVSLGLEKRKPAEPDILTIAAEIDAEQAALEAREAEKPPQMPQDQRSDENSRRKCTDNSLPSQGDENDDLEGDDHG